MPFADPFLYFNFSNEQGNIEPLQFRNPYKVLIAYKQTEVMPILKEINEHVHKGAYAAGFITYEAAGAFDDNYQVHTPDEHMPLLWFGLFQKPKRQSIPYKVNGKSISPNWEFPISQDKYLKQLTAIQSDLKQFNVQQLNFTLALKTKWTIDSAFDYYMQLKHAQEAKYTSYLNIGRLQILSISPELFFRIKDDVLTVKPMKGTIDRGKTYAEDIEKYNWLQKSMKNKIENDITVQLMIEELQKVTDPQSIQIEDPYKIETYPTVFQMTSTIKGRMNQHLSWVDILKTLFPSGSITGNPKKEAMRFIHKYEHGHRGAYCGAIGYITPDREAIFNVPIRTVTIDSLTEKATFGVGSGITLNSPPKEEFEELRTKAEFLTLDFEPFQLLESFGLKNGEYIVFEDHIQRLEQSAAYFNFELDKKTILLDLTQIRNDNPNGSYKVRLLVNKNGSYDIDVQPIKGLDEPVHVGLAKTPIDSKNPFLYHKTTKRSHYEKHLASQPNMFDVLLWNEKGDITEFTMGNIIIEKNGKRITPPVECGLLQGTYRTSLVKKGVIEEGIIHKADLMKATKIWFINSVREWVHVKLHI